MEGVIPITHLGLDDDQTIEHCKHIISHSERYEKERVFEAKTVLNNYRTSGCTGASHKSRSAR